MPRASEEQLPASGCFRNDRGHDLWEENATMSTTGRLVRIFVEEKTKGLVWYGFGFCNKPVLTELDPVITILTCQLLSQTSCELLLSRCPGPRLDLTIFSNFVHGQTQGGRRQRAIYRHHRQH